MMVPVMPMVPMMPVESPVTPPMDLLNARHVVERNCEAGGAGERDGLSRAARAAGADHRGGCSQCRYGESPHGVSLLL
jgi:hypothetical protein